MSDDSYPLNDRHPGINRRDLAKLFTGGAGTGFFVFLAKGQKPPVRRPIKNPPPTTFQLGDSPTASITSISPAGGPVTGGTQLTIIGTGFTGANAILFDFGGGKAIGANPASVTDTQITVLTPAVPNPGVVDVRVNVPTGQSPIVPADQFTFGVPQTANALFVVVNQTTVPDELVFVKFLGAEIQPNALLQTFGNGQPLANGGATASVSYSLAQMTAAIPNAPAPTPAAPIFAINDYSGGRIYFSLGVPLQATIPLPAAQNPTDPDFTTVYAFVEPSVFPSTSEGSTNLDASYVDFVGVPVSIAIKSRSTGALVKPPQNNPLTSPPGNALFNALTEDSQIPTAAVIAAKTTATTARGQQVKIGGIARILSPSVYESSLIPNAASYHGWAGAGELISQLRSSQAALNVASYTTADAGVSVPAGTLFGFSGAATSDPPIGQPWQQKQNYSLTATAVPDLNPGGSNPRVPQLEGISGIQMTGKGDVVGNFAVYLTDTDLDMPTGVYGANPAYVIDWLGGPSGAQAFTLSGIVNDLSGRVVGDLLAGFNFGWALATSTVQAKAAANGTGANLAGTVFAGSLAGTPIGQLTTGQLFYLLSLQPTVQNLSLWFGSGIQANPAFYNNYASDFQSLTNAYNMAFTDRLESQTNPDMFFTPSDDIYVEITLLPGAYTVAAG
jgi:hypothetical protein